MTKEVCPYDQAYDAGQNDAANGFLMTPYEYWQGVGHAAYKAGYEDYMNYQYPEQDE